MPIKIWDYFKEYENEKEEIHSAIDKVFKSGRLVLGESVKNFEREFSKYCGVKYGVGVNSGTDALFLALKALGIGQGDEGPEHKTHTPCIFRDRLIFFKAQ